MVAGEASGDQLGAHLIAALKARRPQLQFAGIGGPRMAAQGFDVRVPMEKLAVRGYAEALRHYREITRIRRDLVRALLADRGPIFLVHRPAGQEISHARRGHDRRGQCAQPDPTLSPEPASGRSRRRWS